MITIGRFDPEARAEEKSRRREKDMDDIRSGRRSAEEVREANTLTPRGLQINWAAHVPGRW